MTNGLMVAEHQDQTAYWEGGHYELNLSFGTLRDKQWQRAIQAIWSHPAVYGPLADRYTPGGAVPALSAVQVPPPTATLTEHGQMQINDMVIGFDLQSTRSLFECISVMIPLGMFAGFTGSAEVTTQQAKLQALDVVLYDIALRVFDATPFKIAAVGYERGCQLPFELLGDSDLCAEFLKTGNALAHEEVLSSLKMDVGQPEQVRANLFWLAPQS